MSKLIITHAPSLNGTVRVSGSKNSALPILAASLLGDGESIIEEIPNLRDVEYMCELIKWLGSDVEVLKE